MTASMEMSPTVAKRLFDEGAVLIIAGIPIGTEFGIDLCSYKIDERFRGIKMIPPGAHFIYCSTQSQYSDAAPRVGFIHYFKPYEILVRQWDYDKEELCERIIPDSDLEKRRIRENLKDLDRFLGAYDYRFVIKWKNLTDTITEEGVIRCAPDCGAIRSNVSFLSCPDSERPRGSKRGNAKISKISASNLTLDESDLLPNLKPLSGTTPNFIELPPRIPEKAQPEDITKHYMDSSCAVNKLMEHDILMEEIQLSFICFLTGYSIESLHHWRQILNILSNSEESIGKYKIFYIKYMEVLQYHLELLPEELMQQTDNNTICKDVRKLLVNGTLSGLSISANNLSKYLKKKLNWEFNNLLDEDPEDLPVIVDM